MLILQRKKLRIEKKPKLKKKKLKLKNSFVIEKV